MDLNKLIARVKGILLTPKTEWPLIAGEPATVGDLYKGYIVWLAAIPPLVGFLVTARFSATIALSQMIVTLSPRTSSRRRTGCASPIFTTKRPFAN